MKQRSTTVYLWLNGLLYLLFGAWCALDPVGTSTAVGFTLPGHQGFAEYVAVYGGLEFGVGVFFILCAIKAELRSAGVIFGTCFYLGICLFRSYAISQIGFDIGAGLNFYISECLLTLWSLTLVRGHLSRTL